MKILFALALLTATAGFGIPAQAQNYPWCAEYGGGDMGGATNCGFTTYEQCMETLRGMGGFCNPNTQYRPPPGARTYSRAPRRYSR